ncbi:hypothetical protein [Streptomyces sp. MJP52]|uniref:hypothetical protein n=1 Tax=Streptomyces sp. MJP52 TaxID=2940555 RepID=UPI0024732B94|nr:hypothetical protein [Streptomyces sp. MJP52]MDH6224384.1 hypothetical protein [Streptomyces sp. MJP52]
MNAAAAAAKSRVTTDTIRTWCRRGVITATKTAGRWDIDEKSLRAHRRRLTAIRQARRARAAATVHARIAARLTLPQLAGTPKQTAWATDIRDRAVAAALQLVTHNDYGQPTGRTTYQLATGHTQFDRDPLNAYPVLRDTAYTEHADEADYVTALNAVLAARTDARYWIDTHR